MLSRSRLAVAAAFVTLPLFGQSTPAQDLSVSFIERLPKIDYVWGSDQPDIDGWPLAGSEVTWVAHVRNNGSALARAAYRWTVDGAVVAEGSLDLAPQAYTTATLPWTWTFARREIAFEIDPANLIAESQERNNRLRVDSNALAVAFWVEQSHWDQTLVALRRFDAGAVTLDDWLQRKILVFNGMAALARWPETPRGVSDRLRIDAIHVVPDGALPLSPPPEVALEYPPEARAIRFPDAADRTIDIQWGFTAADYPVPSRAADLYDSLIHELGHARYLVDVYAWGVSSWRGDRVMLDPAPPYHAGAQSWFDTPHWGLMNIHFGFIDRHSAAALNRIAGHRATRGNYNPPENLGSFLNDLPERTRVRLVGPDGSPLANARVRIYRSSAEFFPEGRVYPKTYDGEADLERTSDGDGWIELPRNPFAEGSIVHGRESGRGYGSNVTAIVRVDAAGGEPRWGFLESIDFNLAYWRGEVELFEYELTVGGPFCSAARFPTPTFPPPESRVDSRRVQFLFQAATPPAHAELWIAPEGEEPRLAGVYPSGSRNIEVSVPPGRIGWWIEAAYDDCPAARSATYFFDHDVPPARSRLVARP